MQHPKWKEELSEHRPVTAVRAEERQRQTGLDLWEHNARNYLALKAV